MSSVLLLGYDSDKQHSLQTATWYRWNGNKKPKDWIEAQIQNLNTNRFKPGFLLNKRNEGFQNSH